MVLDLTLLGAGGELVLELAVGELWVAVGVTAHALSAGLLTLNNEGLHVCERAPVVLAELLHRDRLGRALLDILRRGGLFPVKLGKIVDRGESVAWPVEVVDASEFALNDNERPTVWSRFLALDYGFALAAVNHAVVHAGLEVLAGDLSCSGHWSIPSRSGAWLG